MFSARFSVNLLVNNCANMKKILHILLILLLLPLAVRAQTFPDISQMSAANDSSRVSLLTCAPGQSLYRLYGHTALRVRGAKESQILSITMDFSVLDSQDLF